MEWSLALGDISIKIQAGEVVRSAYYDVWRFRDGKIVELNAFVVRTEKAETGRDKNLVASIVLSCGWRRLHDARPTDDY